MAQQNRGKPPLPNASDWIDVEVPTRLPIIPLVSSVLFPGGVLSLQVGIDRNVRLLKSLPDDQNLIAKLRLRILYKDVVSGTMVAIQSTP